MIEEWTKVTDACVDLGLHTTNIAKACNGTYNTTGGFKWSYTR